MADPPRPLPSLRLIGGEPDGYCDPVTGLCTTPAAASAATTPDASSADDPAGGPAGDPDDEPADE